MKKQIPIPGEKKLIKAEIERLEKYYGGLVNKEYKKQIAKTIHKKLKRAIRLGAIYSLLGITTISGVKLLNESKEDNIKIEQNSNDKIVDSSEKENDFKEQLKVNDKNLQVNEEKQEFEKLENKEEFLRYLKDMYIEKYEEKTGDKQLTTEDIKLLTNYENYVYKNKDTGEIITHGDIPNETEQHLKTDKVEYEIIENVEVYKVVNKNDGQIIDCVTLQNKEGKSIPVKVRVGNQYEKEYISVLEDMGMVIPKGINYYEHYEEQNDLPKREFIKAVEELEKNTKVDELEDERT